MKKLLVGLFAGLSLLLIAATVPLDPVVTQYGFNSPGSFIGGTFIGNGSGLTNLAAGKVSGTLTNVGFYYTQTWGITNSSYPWTIYSKANEDSVNVHGALNAAAFVGDGSLLTALDATALGSGTVPTARLGSGTANSASYLRGDQTWAAITGADPNSLTNFDSRPWTNQSATVYTSGKFVGVGDMYLQSLLQLNGVLFLQDNASSLVASNSATSRAVVITNGNIWIGTTNVNNSNYISNNVNGLDIRTNITVNRIFGQNASVANITANGDNSLTLGGGINMTSGTQIRWTGATTISASTSAPDRFTVLNTVGATGASISLANVTGVTNTPLGLEFVTLTGAPPYNRTNVAFAGTFENYVATAVGFTLTTTNSTVLLTSSDTITLPTSVGLRGRTYTLKAGSGVTITLATTSSQTIDGSAPGTITALQSRTFISDGTNWWITSGF